ncbi:class I SAM-dependent methyltransferase [Patescibacteria group bacterium]|nr:class I SAM-dependent methyltransferase [Patescibacteria group bacterium]MBU4511787.1 class I SAM-dependent methyltransferase [Patescibacteria group bacterium]
MSNQEIIKRFDDCAKDYLEKYYGDKVLNHQGYPQAVIRRQYLFEMLTTKSGNVLDIGCGVGNIAYDFYLLGFRVWGIDISSKMVEEARKKIPAETQIMVERLKDRIAGDSVKTGAVKAIIPEKEPRVEPSLFFDCADFLEKEYPNDFFDCVIALGFIEYVDSPELVIEKISRIAKSGGEVFITVPLNSCIYKKIKKPKKEQDSGNFAYHYFSYKKLDELCGKYGLIKKDFHFFHFFIIPPFIDKILNKIIGADKVIIFNQRFERWSRRVSSRFLAGGYLIKAVKK